MIHISKVGPGAVAYYLDGGRPATGRWWGSGCEHLGLSGGVDRQELLRLLQGRHPGDGGLLLERYPARRRGGWDVMLSAPKSLSLLAALHPDSDSIRESHEAAVAGVLERVERSLTVRRKGDRQPASGGLAAIFVHTSNAADEPHLHTHALVANLGRGPDGVWSPVTGSDWQVARTGLFATYQLALRHHLEQAGWELEWRIRPDGLADVAGIPREAVRAASSQTWAIKTQGWYRARERAVAQPWSDRSVRAGFGVEEAAQHRHGLSGLAPGSVPGAGGTGSGPPSLTRPPGPARAGRTGPPGPSGRTGPTGPDLERLVSERLLRRRSAFRREDVLDALASTYPGGLAPGDADRWVDGFCASCRPAPSPTKTGRWTTDLAVAADQRLIELATGSRSGVDRPAGRGSGPSEIATSLQTSGRPTVVLGAQPGWAGLVAHGMAVEEAASIWRAAGMTVGVHTRTEREAARWEALTGLPRYRAGRPPDVLVVDQADRRSAPELISLLSRAQDRGSLAVLVEGGTMPRLSEPISRGLCEIGDQLGRIATSAWTERGELNLDASTDIGGFTPRVTPGRAIAHLASAWQGAGGGSGEGGPILVGLGPDEVRHLNSVARSILAERGQIGGPAVRVQGRSLQSSSSFRSYQAGDRVMALNGQDRDRAPGSQGTVLAVDRGEMGMTVRWDEGGLAHHLGRDLHSIGLGYATTPELAYRSQAPALLLGSEEAVPKLQGRIIESARAGRELGREREQALDRDRRRESELRLGSGLGL